MGPEPTDGTGSCVPQNVTNPSIGSTNMIEFQKPTPDVVIRAPLPHVDITEIDLITTRSEFQKLGINLSFRAEEVYPVSATWAEIAILAGTFIGGAAASHYAEKLFDALDRFLKKSIKEINLGVSCGDNLNYHVIPRNDRAAAIAAIKKALEEIEQSDDDSA